MFVTVSLYTILSYNMWVHESSNFVPIMSSRRGPLVRAMWQKQMGTCSRPWCYFKICNKHNLTKSRMYFLDFLPSLSWGSYIPWLFRHSHLMRSCVRSVTTKERSFCWASVTWHWCQISWLYGPTRPVTGTPLLSLTFTLYCSILLHVTYHFIFAVSHTNLC
jgi:hypothetical protein